MKHLFKKEKKSVVAVALFMSLGLASFSQSNKFSLSINSLNANFNYGKSNSMLQRYKKDFKGLQIGASYQAGISPMFSVVPEIYFAMKGGVLKNGNPITANKSIVRLYTVSVPILARLHFNKLYVNAGPYVAYTLGGRLKTEGAENLPGKSATISFGRSPGDFRRWDLGVQAGVGYNFRIKRSILTLDARYGYGFVNISGDVERYNRMLNLSLLVARPHKKTPVQNKG